MGKTARELWLSLSIRNKRIMEWRFADQYMECGESGKGLHVGIPDDDGD